MTLRIGLPRPRHAWHTFIASTASSCGGSPRYSSVLSTGTASDRQTVALPDGRVLGFAEYGKPDGKPLLYFHGYPSSRREAAPITKEIGQLGIRLISVDRPGIGSSTYQPGRTIRDFAQDVRVLADALELKRFAVLGSSGGGPYAIACALVLPPERLSVSGVFAGAPAWEVGAHLVSRPRRCLAYLAEHWPRFLKGLMMASVSSSQWLLRRQWIQKKLDDWFVAVFRKARDNEGKPMEELSPEKLAELREQTMNPFIDHFEQGAEGFLQETRLLVRPWGFKFEDVGGRVQMYHGAKDTNSNPQMMRLLAERLPNCDLQEFETDDHYTTGRHSITVMEKLVSDDENKRI